MRPLRSTTDTDVTAYIPRMDDDQLGWHDRLRREAAPRHRRPTPAYADRGVHMGDVSDLPGPSRRELARMVRQVRMLAILANVLFLGAYGYGVYLLIFR